MKTPRESWRGIHLLHELSVIPQLWKISFFAFLPLQNCSKMSNLVQLRRHDTGQSWGFRMNGGAEFGQPLFIQKVNPNSLSWKAGLRPGDGILQICNTIASNMTHEQAKMEIIRAGNEVDFIVQRNAVPVAAPAQPAPRPKPQPAPEEDVGDAGIAVQSRSFKILQQQLQEEQAHQ